MCIACLSNFVRGSRGNTQKHLKYLCPVDLSISGGIASMHMRLLVGTAFSFILVHLRTLSPGVVVPSGGVVPSSQRCEGKMSRSDFRGEYMHEVHMEGWPWLSRPRVHRHGRTPCVSPSRSRTLGRADCAVAPAYGGHAQFHPGFTITESLFMKYQGCWGRFSVGQASEGEFFIHAWNLSDIIFGGWVYSDWKY